MARKNDKISPRTQECNRLGHRYRARKKFSAGTSIVADYELLELLLFHAIPRKDTRNIAKNLLECFGSLKNTIFADHFELKKIKEVGDSSIILLAIIRELFNRIHLEQATKSVTISSSGQVIEYYKNLLEFEKKEQFRVMFLNNKNKLLAEEMLQYGTINHTTIYLREIVQRALELGSSALIVVHNHPSGDPQPSRQDVIITKMIKDVTAKLDILLLDHLVIGKNDCCSMKEMGLI
ncbi:MAG: DNA repair protein RadC [Holosporaceae bacterium]|jgi:DNA repair protein RadC|nr:DNA repair protein RadC [Holosporaceae bacterium]